MTPKNAKPENIAGYIKAAPPEAREKLTQMLTAIRAEAPGAVEGLKWGMPSFSYERILVTFAAHKNHIGFYPTPSAIKTFEPELSKYKTAAGSVQFPLDKPLPVSLVEKITRFRVKESMTIDVKWRT